MRFSSLMAGLLTIGSLWDVHSASSTHCTEHLFKNNALHQISCQEKNGVTIRRFEGIKSNDPYATELDQRVLVIAQSLHADVARKAAGFVRNHEGRWILKRSPLLQPPHDHQVVRRSFSRSKAFGVWTLSTEHIAYGAQGGALGFPMDCVTAFRTSPLPSTAVVECHSLEEHERFLSTLNDLP